MAAPVSAYKDRQFIAVIGDEVNPFPSYDTLISITYGLRHTSGLGHRFATCWHRCMLMKELVLRTIYAY